MMAPTMPMRELRRTPMRIISQRVAPSASTASRWLFGTAFMMSRVSEEMMGRIMMARMMLAVSRPTPKFGPSKSPVQPSVFTRNGPSDVAHDRHQDEDRPEAVDDAGNGGQQLGQERDRRAQRTGAKLGEEDGHAQRQRNRHAQGKQRGRQRAEDEGQRAEVARDRVPRLTGEELPAELRPGSDGSE